MTKKKTENPTLPFTHVLAIGDWSCDGHGRSDMISFNCSHDESAVKTAYAKAVQQSGVSLHEHHRNSIKGDRFPPKFIPKWNNVCGDCDDAKISDKVKTALEEMGVDFKKVSPEEEPDEDGLMLYPESVAILFFEMVKTQITDFVYSKCDRNKTLNGYWSEDFNVNFGYGCYDTGC